MNAHPWGPFHGQTYRPVAAKLHRTIPFGEAVGGVLYETWVTLACREVLEGGTLGAHVDFVNSGLDAEELPLIAHPVPCQFGPLQCRLDVRVYQNQIPITQLAADASGFALDGVNLVDAHIYSTNLRLQVAPIDWAAFDNIYDPENVLQTFLFSMTPQSIPFPFLSDRGLPGSLPVGVLECEVTF